jgi:hypothetical protein
MKRPENGVELVYDDFHPEVIRLETKNGEIKLVQTGVGLPSSCVILINLGGAKAGTPSKVYPAASLGVMAHGEADYEYYPCQKA